MDVRTMSRALKSLRKGVTDLRAPLISELVRTDKDPFKVLISCLLSLRTKDETTRGASERLFKAASTPEGILTLDEEEIRELIYPVGFYRNKARTVRKVSKDLLERFDGRVPDDIDDLLTLDGVGRKTANLVVTMGYGKPGICVDTHVHRISNRLGFVLTKTPEQTEMELRRKLPPEHWMEINDLLVTWGQNICKPITPLCSKCVVYSLCEQVGVEKSR